MATLRRLSAYRTANNGEKTLKLEYLDPSQRFMLIKNL